MILRRFLIPVSGVSLPDLAQLDNFLKLYFISEKAKMSTLLVFLGTFGGLAAWGFLGIFLGPLILSLFVFFLDTYRNAWELYQQEGREDAPS